MLLVIINVDIEILIFFKAIVLKKELPISKTCYTKKSKNISILSIQYL